MKTALDSLSRLGAAVLSLTVVGALGCQTEEDTRATASIIDAQGDQIGTASFRTIPEGVLMTIDIQDLPPGEHGLHIHERGECTPPQFESAGGHLAGDSQNHGFLDADRAGAHAGDMLNLVINDAGKTREYRVLEDVTLRENAAADSASLLREGGTAVVIHMNPDDYRTDPAGNGGARIACGVIRTPTGT